MQIIKYSPEFNSLLGSVIYDAITHGIDVSLLSTSNRKRSKLGGFFCGTTKLLTCYTESDDEDDWKEYFIHEAGHMYQHIEKEPVWVKDQNPSFPCIFTKATKIKKGCTTYDLRKRTASFKSRMRVEVNCAERMLVMIKKFKIPADEIDVVRLIAQSNAYNCLYRWAYDKQSLCFTPVYRCYDKINENEDLKKSLGKSLYDADFCWKSGTKLIQEILDS